jgi:hypothetical protein
MNIPLQRTSSNVGGQHNAGGVLKKPKRRYCLLARRYSDSLFEFGQHLLEAGFAAEDVVVGIVFDPVAFAPAAGEDTFEKFESGFFLSSFGV